MIDRQTVEGMATGEPEADALVREDGNAVVIGGLLDQQVRAEMAFTGPHKLKERLGHLDMQKIAEMDSEAFGEVFSESPAVHRFTNMMVGWTQDVAREIADKYGGDASAMWNDGADIEEVKARAGELPGFGEAKTETLVHALDFFGYRSFEEVRWQGRPRTLLRNREDRLQAQPAAAGGLESFFLIPDVAFELLSALVAGRIHRDLGWHAVLRRLGCMASSEGVGGVFVRF